MVLLLQLRKFLECKFLNRSGLISKSSVKLLNAPNAYMVKI